MCTNAGGAKVPAAIQATVEKVKELTKRSQYGVLQGDIKVTKDENGNYNLTYTQVKKYERLKSYAIGVGDTPARQETTRTTYVLNSEGKRINTIRNTETDYYKAEKRQNNSDDWTGTNANMGTTRTAQRRLKNAMKWAELQKSRR